MSRSSNESAVRNLFLLIENGDKVNVGEVFSSNWVNHDPSLPPMRGLEGARQLIGFWSGLTNKKFLIEDSLIDGDRVAVRFVLTGNHNGELMGIAPTGKTITIAGSGFFRVAAGKVVDNWVNIDALGLLQQLGATPGPEKSLMS